MYAQPTNINLRIYKIISDGHGENDKLISWVK